MTISSIGPRPAATWVDHLDLRDWSARIQDAAWLIDERRLRENLSAFLAFATSPADILFPVKANPSIPLLQFFAREGAGADCATRHEVRLARWSGVPLERIVYNSPAPDLGFATELLQAGGHVVVDTIRDLHAIDDTLGCTAPCGRLILRINPDISLTYNEPAEYQTLTDHAARTGRFGMPSEEVCAAVRGLRHRVSGLHVHVGTQMDHLGSFTRCLHHLHDLADQLERVGHPIEWIDLGGGLGIPFDTTTRFPTVPEFAAELAPLRRPGLRYAVEPGHALVGDAVALLTRILRRKEVRGRRWAIASVGTDLLAKVTLLRWRHGIVGPNGPLPTVGEDSLAGPLCFAGDILLEQTCLDGVDEGDLLAVRDAGAYCSALANRFNGRLGPPTWWLSPAGEATLVVEPERWSLEPGLVGALWGPVEPPPSRGEPIDTYVQLSSDYLRRGADEDRITPIAMARSAERSFHFVFDVRSSLEVVSAPLALRIAGDACIVAALASLGLSHKVRPVWARTVVMDLERPVAACDHLPVSVRVSHMETRADGRASLLARFMLGADDCKGTMHLVCE